MLPLGSSSDMLMMSNPLLDLLSSGDGSVSGYRAHSEGSSPSIIQPDADGEYALHKLVTSQELSILLDMPTPSLLPPQHDYTYGPPSSYTSPNLTPPAVGNTPPLSVISQDHTLPDTNNIGNGDDPHKSRRESRKTASRNYRQRKKEELADIKAKTEVMEHTAQENVRLRAEVIELRELLFKANSDLAQMRTGHVIPPTDTLAKVQHENMELKKMLGESQYEAGLLKRDLEQARVQLNTLKGRVTPSAVQEAQTDLEHMIQSQNEISKIEETLGGLLKALTLTLADGSGMKGADADNAEDIVDSAFKEAQVADLNRRFMQGIMRRADILHSHFLKTTRYTDIDENQWMFSDPDNRECMSEAHWEEFMRLARLSRTQADFVMQLVKHMDERYAHIESVRRKLSQRIRMMYRETSKILTRAVCNPDLPCKDKLQTAPPPPPNPFELSFALEELKLTCTEERMLFESLTAQLDRVISPTQQAMLITYMFNNV
eukprot:TRINITY_DN6244_c0_g1_i6.p1 TRINITY_DN6244_c0_g1~~TRINITY_DN6244_c0_g1_i6.p1  ORF type:complete len:512 (+),score=129.62 TRINITY_DN6244_c0_g1_i6:70-1536(+)